MNISFDINEKTGQVKISTTISGETRLTCLPSVGEFEKNAQAIHLIAEKMINQFVVKEEKKINVNPNPYLRNSLLNQNPYVFDASSFSFGTIDRRV